jgi:3-hydroxymyristoyl/3-hydroxydecanoyl-(acyl carrier protein) dehydratase
MKFETRGVISADHPALAGHFPGNPIVPGVIILDEVLQAIADWRPAGRLLRMPTVKFLAPLRPEQAFTIRLVDADAGRVRFECLREDGQLIVQGLLVPLADLSERPRLASTGTALPD